MTSYLRRLVSPPPVSATGLEPVGSSQSPIAERDQRLHVDAVANLVPLDDIAPAEPSPTPSSSPVQRKEKTPAAPRPAPSRQPEKVQRFTAAPSAPIAAPGPIATLIQAPSRLTPIAPPEPVAPLPPAPEAPAGALDRLEPADPDLPVATPHPAMKTTPVPPDPISIAFDPASHPSTSRVLRQEPAAEPPPSVPAAPSPEPIHVVREIEKVVSRPAVASPLRSLESDARIEARERTRDRREIEIDADHEPAQAPGPGLHTVVIRERVSAPAPVVEKPAPPRPAASAPRSAADASVIGPLGRTDYRRAMELWLR